MALVTKNSLGPTITLFRKADYGLIYNAIDHYRQEVKGSELRTVKLLHRRIGRICFRTGVDFDKLRPVEISGIEANVSLRAVSSFVRHELLVDDRGLELLGSVYGHLIELGLDAVHQAIELDFNGLEYDLFDDLVISELVSNPYSRSLQHQDP